LSLDTPLSRFPWAVPSTPTGSAPLARSRNRPAAVRTRPSGCPVPALLEGGDHALLPVDEREGGTKLPASGVPSGWDVEISLDVQVAHEICQNCKVLLVEAAAPTSADLGTAVNTAVAQGANVVSNSYGSYTLTSGSVGTGKGDYAHPHHAIVVSAGDSGEAGRRRSTAGRARAAARSGQ
jgi:hypothetical protein